MIICPNCKTEFETDADIISYVVDSWENGHHVWQGYYECPHCSETYNDIKAFYKE